MPNPTGRDVYFDVPLTNVLIQAFQGAGDFVAGRLAPPVKTDKQSGRYYTLDKDSWLLVPDDLRAPGTPPNEIEFKVSSDGYFADNRALREGLNKEDLANADPQLNLLETAVAHLNDGLLRALEVRVADQVTSITNIGSGVTLAGGDQWSDYVNSDPKAAVNTGHAFGEGQTGLHYNTAVLDKDTYRLLRNHPKVRDYSKFTQAGDVPEAVLKEFLEVENLWVARGIKNVAPRGAANSIVNIWGKNALLCYVNPQALGARTVTFMVGLRWTPEGIPAPMQVQRYDHPDPGVKKHYVEAGYYQDEKVIAAQLGYLIGSSVA